MPLLEEPQIGPVGADVENGDCLALGSVGGNLDERPAGRKRLDVDRHRLQTGRQERLDVVLDQVLLGNGQKHFNVLRVGVRAGPVEGLKILDDLLRGKRDVPFDLPLHRFRELVPAHLWDFYHADDDLRLAAYGADALLRPNPGLSKQSLYGATQRLWIQYNLVFHGPFRGPSHTQCRYRYAILCEPGFGHLDGVAAYVQADHGGGRRFP